MMQSSTTGQTAADGSGYHLTDDPLYYVAGAFFAFFTTALPAALGQARFLPIVQAIALTILLSIPLRARRTRQAILLISIWLIVQSLTISLLTWLFVDQIERAIPGGFGARTGYLEWFFANAPLMGTLQTAPVERLAEVAGILVGSLVSGGLIGSWFLMRAVNLAAFHAGSLLMAMGSFFALPVALPIWTILRISGYAAFVIVLAEPLLTRTWSPAFYLRNRRRLLVTAAILLILGLLLELVLPGPWRNFFSIT